MDAIVEEIEDALEDKDYKLALMHAKTLEYTLNDEDLEKEWQIKQEYYIDKIYEKAEKNDIMGLKNKLCKWEYPQQILTILKTQPNRATLRSDPTQLQDIR